MGYPPFIASPFLLEVNLVPSHYGSRAPSGRRTKIPVIILQSLFGSPPLGLLEVIASDRLTWMIRIRFAERYKEPLGS